MTSHPSEARERLGQLLMRRRVELDPRYSNRRTFIDERAPDRYRIINALELGRRSNFEPGTKAVIEAAYGLVAGSLDRTLEGGPLEPVETGGTVAQFPARPPVPDPADLPPMFQKLPPDIEHWWNDVSKDLESGGVPRTRLEADVWNSPDIQPEYKHLLIAIFRSGQAAAARGERPNGRDQTGLTPAPRRHLTGVRQ